MISPNHSRRDLELVVHRNNFTHCEEIEPKAGCRRFRLSSRIERTSEKYQRSQYKEEFVRELLEAAALPPEKVFDNFEQMMEWLERRRFKLS